VTLEYVQATKRWLVPSDVISIVGVLCNILMGTLTPLHGNSGLRLCKQTHGWVRLSCEFLIPFEDASQTVQ
jgi:hypothetical protein